MHSTRSSHCRAGEKVARLQAEIERLRSQLEEAERGNKRQAAPLPRESPAESQITARPSGAAYGKHGHRPPPAASISTRFSKRLCRTIAPTAAAISPRTMRSMNSSRKKSPSSLCAAGFLIHKGTCRHCGRRVTWPTSPADFRCVGAAASQLGPPTLQATIVYLNKHSGMSYGQDR